MAKKDNDITKTGAQTYRQLQEQNALTADPSKFMTPEYEKELSRKYFTGQQALATINAKNAMWEPTPYQTPLFQETGGKDYLGKSSFDPNILVGEEANHITDIRAKNQPWYSQAVNGIGKGIVLAGTTFVDGTVGLLAGILQGGYNLADNDKNSGFWQGMWDNPITQAMNDINKWSEEAMPNYYTEAQQNGPWYSADNILSTNFLFDKVVKNMGFMVGAAYSGGIYSKGISGAMKGVKGWRVARAANNAGMTAEQIDRAVRLGQYAVEQNRTSRAIRGAVGSFFNAQAEATVEAVSNSDDFAEAKRAETDNLIRLEIEEATAKYNENKGKLTPVKNAEGQVIGMQDLAAIEYQNTLAALEAKRDRMYQEIEIARRGMGTADFAFNIPILWAGDALTLGKFYAGGWKAARTEAKTATRATKEAMANAKAAANAGDKEAIQNLEKIVRKAEKTGYRGLTAEEKKLVEEVQREHVLPSWLGYTKAGIANPLKEGNEEMAQAASAQSAWKYYGDRIDAIYEAYDDPDAKRDVLSWSEAIARGFSSQYGNFENYEEAFVGALTGLLGSPTIGRANNSTNQTWLGKGKMLGFSGGTITDIRDYAKGRKQALETAQRITEIMQNPELENRLKHLVAQTYFDNEKNRAIIHDDKRSFKDAETAAIFEDIMYLKKGQRLDLLQNAIDYMNMEFSDEEIQEIVDLTSKVESAYNSRVNDEKKRRDSLAPQIDAYNQNISALQQELDQREQQLKTITDPDQRTLMETTMEKISNDIEKTKKQRDAAKRTLDALDVSISSSAAVDYSPYIKSDGTFMSSDEIRADLKERAQNVQRIINDISETQEEIDKSTGDSYTDEQLATLTWYSVMMRDWDRRSNGILNEVRAYIQQAIDDPSVNQMLDLLSAYEAGKEREDGSLIYGGLKNMRKWKDWQDSLLKQLSDIIKRSTNDPEYSAGATLAAILSDDTEVTLKDEKRTKVKYGEFLLDQLKGSVDSNPVIATNDAQKEYLKKQLDDLRELGIARRKYNALLEEFRKNPDKIEQAHVQISKSNAAKVADKRAQGIADRFDWNAPVGTILTTLEQNMPDINNLGGIDAFIKMLNIDQQKLIRAALRLQKGINGLKTSVEESDLSDTAASIANRLIDENIEDVDNISELANKINEDLNSGYVERAASALVDADERYLAEHVPQMEEDIQQMFNDSLTKITETLSRIEAEDEEKITKAAEEFGKKEEQDKNLNAPVEKNEEEEVPVEGEFKVPKETTENKGTNVVSSSTGGEKKTTFRMPIIGQTGYERRPQITEMYFGGVNGEKYSDALEKGYIAYPNGVKDKEAYLKYIKEVEDTLKSVGAYNYVHNTLKPGDTITFSLDEELSKKAGTNVVVMKVGDQIVGTIRTKFEFDMYHASGKKNVDIEAQEKLFNAVVNGQQVSTTVESLLGGQIPQSSTNTTLTNIYGNKKPIIAVVNGEGQFITSDNSVKHADIVHSNQQAGQVYVLIPQNNGKYLPALLVPTKISDLTPNDPYIQAAKEAFVRISSSATEILQNMFGFWKLIGIDADAFHVNLYNRQGNKYTPVASFTEANTLAIRIGKDFHRNVPIVDGKANTAVMEKIFFEDILKKFVGNLITRVDMNRIKEEGYVENFVMPYNLCNLYRTESVNDWFTYKPTDIEQKSKASTPTSTKVPQGTPKTPRQTEKTIVDGVEVEVKNLDEITLDGVPATPAQKVAVVNEIDRNTPATVKGVTPKKGNSAFGVIDSSTKTAGSFRARKGRRKNMAVTEETSKEPRATKQRDAIDMAEVKRMFPNLGEQGIKIVHAALLRSTDGQGNPIKAYGLFKDGMITISKKHPVGTVYHEAFHYVVDFLLSDEQKERLKEAAEEQYGNLPELELEDKVAEGFREFMNARNDASLKGKIKSFFSSLKHIINNLIGRENYIDSLFYDLYKGNYAQIDTTENYHAKLEQYRQQKFAYENLTEEEKQYMQARGTTQESYDSMTAKEKEVFLHCM